MGEKMLGVRALGDAMIIFVIRRIGEGDNPRMEQIIREVLLEFDAVGPGTSAADEELRDLCGAYRKPRCGYFVAVSDGTVVGGAGLAPLEGAGRDLCEIKKMYLLKAARGQGLGRELLERCLAAAGEYGFESCYLETLSDMKTARRLYESYGFRQISTRMGSTGHRRCDCWYQLSDLATSRAQS